MLTLTNNPDSPYKCDDITVTYGGCYVIRAPITSDMWPISHNGFFYYWILEKLSVMKLSYFFILELSALKVV